MIYFQLSQRFSVCNWSHFWTWLLWWGLNFECGRHEGSLKVPKLIFWLRTPFLTVGLYRNGVFPDVCGRNGGHLVLFNGLFVNIPGYTGWSDKIPWLNLKIGNQTLA